MIDAKRAEKIRERLLRWYHSHKRDLPWRRSTHPYDIWISEIMAQQTRITALLPYYERFLARFPDVDTLARADEQEVLKHWEGLGYYSRARNLHKAAQIVVQDFHGQLPSTEKELRSLPGIGEYTAGAILSIAFGQPTPAVDGNVLRVYARVALDPTDISTPPAKVAAREFAAACMPAEHPGHFTQALMELGALICTPKSPQCTDCPLAPLCLALAEGDPSSLPVKPAKKAKKEQSVTILLLTDPSGHTAMRQRTEALLRGMWEFVTIPKALTQEDVSAHLSTLGITARSVRPIGSGDHVFTHIIWHMQGYHCRVDTLYPLTAHLPVPPDQIATLAIPTAFQRFAAALS